MMIRAMGCASSSSEEPLPERQGAPEPADAFVARVYDQLKRIARRQMGGERREHTLQPTALVHEAYLRLERLDPAAWADRGRFYAAAARAMRQILIDHARARGAAKRGGGRQRVAISMAELAAAADPAEFLAVDEALLRLKEMDPRAGSVAELRLYTGLPVKEVAEALDLPLRTVERDWAYARTWLYERLKT
jgi:RNA polymerase sigma factor (TIGR02999 family)